MTLSDFVFIERYQKPNDGVAGLYRGCLSRTATYDRLTMYFSQADSSLEDCRDQVATGTDEEDGDEIREDTT